MTAPSTQSSLFDSGLVDTTQVVGQTDQAAARARMKAMIERLRGTDMPPWRTQNEVILDDGAFRRAMRLVPKDEAQVLWAEFDTQMQRLYDIWTAASGVGRISEA